MPYQVKSTTIATTKAVTPTTSSSRKTSSVTGGSSSTSTSSSSSTPKLELYTGSKTKTEYDEPTSTFNDLLNSFQKEPTTTRRPQLTTFSDADDIAFLKGLVRITHILPFSPKIPYFGLKLD